ncbi:MAG: replication protein [Acidobacteriota bacterium]|nr:replication protein [Acidobacteriota bacterium]
MTDAATAKKKPRRRAIKPLAVDAFTNQQLSLFQGFLANTDDERDALSNAIDLWDSIPRYSIPRKKEDELRLAGGFLPVRGVDFQYRGKAYTAQIRPARLDVKDKDGRPTGETIEHYPSAREELIEHALRKLAAEQNAGFFDRPDYRSGVAFSLYRLRQELASQGHAMTYEGLAEGLEVMHYAFLGVVDEESDPDDPSMISQPYLPALAKVNRKGRAADPDAKWFVQFHGLVTDSINQITYRQFNYQRLMKCSTQLARWLISQLVLKFTQAAITQSFQMKFSTIKRDSGLLNGYARQRDALGALDTAWEEVKELGALYLVKKTEQRGSRAKLEDVTYTVFPSREFSAEQKAANRRMMDAKTAGHPLQQQGNLAPLLEDPAKGTQGRVALVDKASRLR